MLCRVKSGRDGSSGATTRYGCMGVVVCEGALVDVLVSDLEEDLAKFLDMD